MRKRALKTTTFFIMSMFILLGSNVAYAGAGQPSTGGTSGTR